MLNCFCCRRECYCDDKIPSYYNYADEEDCNMKCEGNGLQQCGGVLRISMFHTGKSGKNNEKGSKLLIFLCLFYIKLQYAIDS